MRAAPINPSDLGFIQGIYGTRRPTRLPVVAGLEGTGTVHELGPDAPQELLGKQVALYLNPQTDWERFHGCWAEYLPVKVEQLVPLHEGTDYMLGACACVNPLAALGFMDIIKKSKTRSVIHTAAASALGKILVNLARDAQIDVINVVRSKKEFCMMENLREQHILDFTQPDFEARLADKVKQLNPLVAFNAVANDLAAKVLKALPENGTMYQYSNIGLKPMGDLLSEEFLFKNRSIRGFWILRYLPGLKPNELAEMKQKIADDLEPGGKHWFSAPIQAEFSLEKYEEARKAYVKNMTKGKVLLQMSI